MSQNEIQDAFMDFFINLADGEDVTREDLPAYDSVRTFADAGLMTYNSGLVFTMSDGSEIQLQIVQSRDAH